MKFEYDESGKQSECVAFIDEVGDLCINSNGDVTYLLKCGSVLHDCDGFDTYMSDNGVVKKFYPGDKITITF